MPTGPQLYPNFFENISLSWIHKSSSDVAVNPVGAEAVTAVKLAVEGIVIEARCPWSGVDCDGGI